MNNLPRPFLGTATHEETMHPRDWTKEIIQKEIGGPYADYALDPDFCKWLKECLTEAIEGSLPDNYRPIRPAAGGRHSVNWIT